MRTSRIPFSISSTSGRILPINDDFQSYHLSRAFSCVLVLKAWDSALRASYVRASTDLESVLEELFVLV